MNFLRGVMGGPSAGPQPSGTETVSGTGGRSAGPRGSRVARWSRGAGVHWCAVSFARCTGAAAGAGGRGAPLGPWRRLVFGRPRSAGPEGSAAVVVPAGQRGGGAAGASPSRGGESPSSCPRRRVVTVCPASAECSGDRQGRPGALQCQHRGGERPRLSVPGLGSAGGWENDLLLLPAGRSWKLS